MTAYTTKRTQTPQKKKTKERNNVAKESEAASEKFWQNISPDFGQSLGRIFSQVLSILIFMIMAVCPMKVEPLKMGDCLRCETL